MKSQSDFRADIELAKQQVSEATPEVMSEYLAEFAELDGALADGLEDLPWQPVIASVEQPDQSGDIPN